MADKSWYNACLTWSRLQYTQCSKFINDAISKIKREENFKSNKQYSNSLPSYILLISNQSLINHNTDLLSIHRILDELHDSSITISSFVKSQAIALLVNLGLITLIKDGPNVLYKLLTFHSYWIFRKKSGNCGYSIDLNEIISSSSNGYDLHNICELNPPIYKYLLLYSLCLISLDRDHDAIQCLKILKKSCGNPLKKKLSDAQHQTLMVSTFLISFLTESNNNDFKEYFPSAYLYAFSLLKNSKYQESEDIFRFCSSLYSVSFFQSSSMIGYLYCIKNDYDHAIQVYMQLLSDPLFTSSKDDVYKYTAFNLSVISCLQNSPSIAIQYLQALLSNESSTNSSLLLSLTVRSNNVTISKSSLYYWLGYSYMISLDFKNATEYFSNCINSFEYDVTNNTRRPDRIIVYRQYCYCLSQLSHYDKIIDITSPNHLLEVYKYKNHQDIVLLYYRSQALLAVEQFQESIASVDAAIDSLIILCRNYKLSSYSYNDTPQLEKKSHLPPCYLLLLDNKIRSNLFASLYHLKGLILMCYGNERITECIHFFRLAMFHNPKSIYIVYSLCVCLWKYSSDSHTEAAILWLNIRNISLTEKIRYYQSFLSTIINSLQNHSIRKNDSIFLSFNIFTSLSSETNEKNFPILANKNFTIFDSWVLEYYIEIIQQNLRDSIISSINQFPSISF